MENDFIASEEALALLAIKVPEPLEIKGWNCRDLDPVEDAPKLQDAKSALKELNLDDNN
ncbi:MAG: hypothetical protein HUU54_12835 [Ignavibacteriaceae bacterium]|nr:hypothetical protein [Ignavibacteriaceae bacterium]